MTYIQAKSRENVIKTLKKVNERVFIVTKEHLYTFPKEMTEEAIKQLLEPKYANNAYYEVGKAKTIKTEEV